MLGSTLDETSRVRRRALYRLTPKGKKALERWLTQPIKADDVLRGMPELFLRFSFLEECLGPRARESFLESLAHSLQAYTTTLQEYFKSNEDNISRSARLALRSGIMGYQCQAAWAKKALDEYRNRATTDECGDPRSGRNE
jgi:hypothetical protein